MTGLDVKFTIIGAGVIGCAVAYEIAKDLDGEIVVIEKNPQVKGENQSSRNSGVIHAGIYYPNDFGPLKARLCVAGNNLLYEFCSKYNIPHKKTGKLVVATNEIEEEYLEDVIRVARQNRVKGIKIINSAGIMDLEPNIKGTKALLVPSSGVIDPVLFVDKLYRLSESMGVIFLVESKVAGIIPSKDKKYFSLRIETRGEVEEFNTEFIINCAGLYSDEIARFINTDINYKIEPVKGESAKFYSFKRKDICLNGMNVYPVPFGYYGNGERANVSFDEFIKLFYQHKLTKSVGVHLTPAFDFEKDKYEIGKTITIGPAYSKPQNKEDYSSTRTEEYFYNMILPFFPNIKLEDISLHQAGIRAKLKDYYDFVIERDKKYTNAINLIGIDSPGLTSSLAIAEYVKSIIKKPPKE